MCITEFNEKVYADSIRKEGFAEGRAEGRTEGRVEGRTEGRAEGRTEERTLFMKVIDRVKRGDTPEQIITSGVPKEIVDLVMTLRN